MTEWNRIDKGTGEPLVLLHGCGASAASWLPVIDRLAEHRRVIALDLPGFGRTAASSERLTPTWAVEQVSAELARLGVATPVDFVGNSMGGWISLEAAKHGVARSVVAIGPAGLWRNGMPLLTQAKFMLGICTAWTIKTPVRQLLRHPLAREVLLSVVVDRPRQLSYPEAVGLITDLFTSTPTILRALKFGTRSRFEGGQRISVPVTIVFGTNDRLVPAHNSRFTDQLPTQAHWITLPHCGHVPMFDDPEVVAATILDAILSPADRGATA